MDRHTMQVIASSKSIEWSTPPDLMAEVEAFLGRVDLDPARPDLENGLALTWRGKIYLNPPYGRTIKHWVDRWLGAPLDEGILLVPARVDTVWFQSLWPHAICFIRGRLKFANSKNGAPFPSILAYRGPRAEAFKRAFAHRGHVVIGEGVKKPLAYQLPLELSA